MQKPNADPSISLVPSAQTIGNISAVGGSQVFAGQFIAGNAYIIDSKDSTKDAKETCEKALFQRFSDVDRRSNGKRVPGTCEWIREDVTYQAWLQDDKQLLWIYGSPGKGKTMLSRFLIEELEVLFRNSVSPIVICFFCSSDDNRRNNATSILRGLLCQLLAKQPGLASIMVQYFDTSEKAQESVRSPELLWTMFIKAIQSFELRKLYCVLDGLDECDETSQRWISSKVRELDECRDAIQLVIVSRDIHYLRGFIPKIRLDLDKDDHIRNDIEKFISLKFEELSTWVGLDARFQTAIKRQLLERSEGTFLWIGLAMSELQSKKTRTEIERTLSSLPKGLPGIYSRMLLQIEEPHREDCSKMLRWIAVAVRPLSLLELAAALGTKSTTLVSLDQAIRDQVTMCGFILKDSGEDITLTHQSARDYLLRRGADKDMFVKDFCVEPEEAHLQLAWACLDIISRCDLHDAPLEQHRTEPFVMQDFFLQQHRLLHYAMYSWVDHATSSSFLAKRLMQHPSGFFKKESKLRDEWWRVYCGSKELDLPPLHLACYLGITALVESLVEKDRRKFKAFRMLSKRDSEGLKPLHHAVRQGHVLTVSRLLDLEADIASQGPLGHTALDYAAEKGQIEMMRLLIDRGADVNANTEPTPKSLGPPLFKAARAGHEATVRLLLDSGATIDAKDMRGQTPFYAAAHDNHQGVAKLLLQHGADINAKAEYGCTALHEVACRGFEPMARILIDQGANLDTRTEYGWTALREAAFNDHWALMQLLLEQGATVDSTTQESINESLARQRDRTSSS